MRALCSRSCPEVLSGPLTSNRSGSFRTLAGAEDPDRSPETSDHTRHFHRPVGTRSGEGPTQGRSLKRNHRVSPPAVFRNGEGSVYSPRVQEPFPTRRAHGPSRCRLAAADRCLMPMRRGALSTRSSRWGRGAGPHPPRLAADRPKPEKRTGGEPQDTADGQSHRYRGPSHRHSVFQACRPGVGSARRTGLCRERHLRSSGPAIRASCPSCESARSVWPPFRVAARESFVEIGRAHV